MAEYQVVPYIAEWKRLLLERYLDIEWIDNADEYRCSRCERVAIQHYISNCKHLFCYNCKKIVDDGSAKWKCKQCQQYITHTEQDEETEKRIGRLQVYCLNRRYGCQHRDQLENIFDHLRVCVDTREAILPVPYKGTNTLEMLYDFVGKMNKNLKQLTDHVTTIKDSCQNNNNKMHDKFKELELKVDNKLDDVTRDLKGFKSDLYLQTVRMNSVQDQFRDNKEVEQLITELKQLKEEVNNFHSKHQKEVKDDSDKINKMNGKLKAFVQMLEHKDEKFSQKLNQQKTECEQSANEMKTDFQKKTKEIDEKLNDHENNIKSHNIQLDETSTFNNAIQNLNLQVEQIQTSLAQQMQQVENKVHEMEQIRDKFEGANERELDAMIMPKKMIQLKFDVEELQNTAFPENISLKQSSEENLTSTTGGYDWIITDIDSKLRERNCKIYSEVFKVPGYPFSVRARIVKLKGPDHYYCISLQFSDVENCKGTIEMRPMPKVTYIFKIKSNSKENYDYISTEHCDFSQTIEYEQWAYSRSFLMMVNYEKDDCMKIQIVVEPPSMVCNYFSHNGVLLWRINNQEKKWRLLCNYLIKSIDSPYFYTSPNGYRVIIRFLISKSGGFSSFLYFMSGKNDAVLPKKCPHQVTVTLINQWDESQNLVTNTVTHGEDISELFLFEGVALNERGFVKDDSILLKAVIKPYLK